MLNRTMCDVLEEMRTCCKTLNFSYLLGLIEEAQSAAQKMESKIYTIKDFDHLEKEIKRLKKEQSKLREEIGEKDNIWN